MDFLPDWAESQRCISCFALGVAHTSVLLGSICASEFPRSLLCNYLFIYVLSFVRNVSREFPVSRVLKNIFMYTLSPWVILIKTPMQYPEAFFHSLIAKVYLGVSKNNGTAKWMVYNGKLYQNG